MKNYYHILGLQQGASEDEVRKAYRTLAKRYHPDVNDEEGAHDKFSEVNEAYEFLTDNAQRTNYERLQSEQIDRREQERREHIYMLWVKHQQRQTRYRSAVASEYASRGKKVPYSKLYGGANAFVNVIFLVLFLAITAVPIWRYVLQLSLPEAQQRSIIYFLMPALLGIIFMVYGYYYWFVLKTDKN